jgi:hypothetical protein
VSEKAEYVTYSASVGRANVLWQGQNQGSGWSGEVDCLMSVLFCFYILIHRGHTCMRWL